jgi:hypothetical protein
MHRALDVLFLLALVAALLWLVPASADRARDRQALIAAAGPACVAATRN